MIIAKVANIKPEQAEKMLEKDSNYYQLNLHHHPRNIKEYVVEQYARDMKAGRWKLNAETVKIGAGHRIIDGRHRLRACVRADVPFQTLMAQDVPHEVFDTIDIGATRTAGDLASIAGIKNATAVAHAARIIYGWEQCGHTFPTTSTRSTRPTKTELMATIFKHLGLVESASKMASYRKSAGFVSHGIVTALHYIFSKKDDVLCDTFFQALSSGEALTDQDPVFHLRERLIRARMQRPGMIEPAVVELIVRAWNHTRRGTKLTKLQRGKENERETVSLSAV